MPSRREIALALIVALVLALVWTIPLDAERSWGWDESMHAELPAVRMLVALRTGAVRAAFDAILDCAQYPFVYPLVLAFAQGLFGISEHVCRVTGTLVWVATLVGLFLLGCEIARARGTLTTRGARWIPWFALGLGALSPLALAYAGTLFLEVPFACVSVYALRAWLARARAQPQSGARRSDLVAGAWITAAFFTKFNYGVLLGLGLALDWLVEGALAARAGTFRRFAVRSGWLALIPLAAVLWWFVLPLPGGLEVARDHRQAFVEFLGGNLEMVRTPLERRVLFASSFFALSPRVFVLEVAAALASLIWIRERSVRALWLVLLAMALPIELHRFHLDRFLIPCGVAVWALAAVGLARLLPRPLVLRAAALAALAWIAWPSSARDTLWLADRLGEMQSDPFLQAYQERILAGWSDLRGSRSLPTAGLERAQADALLDAIAEEAGPEGRIGWIGTSPEMSPAALHIGLLARGGSAQRFLRDVVAPIDVTYFSADPGWGDRELAAFAERFDVVLFSLPIDFKNRPNRSFLAGYAARLVETLGWEAREIARTELLRPLQEPQTLRLFACRRGRGS